MASTETTRNQSNRGQQREVSKAASTAVELQDDLIEYMTNYMRKNPARAAAICVGVGFVLGWKLKPW